MRVGVLGGTGPAGKALATRLASVGVPVVIGSRVEERAHQACEDLKAAWPDRDLDLEGGENRAAADADLVVVATPWDGAPATAHSLADQLTGKVLVSMANALTRGPNGFEAMIPSRGSVAAAIQSAAPDALVASAFHHLPAKELGELGLELEADVLICSDHPEATEATADLVRRVPGLRPLDAGGLAAAAPMEAFTAVLLQLNRRYKTRVSPVFRGIDS